MSILQRTGRYIFFVAVFMLVLQVTSVTGQSRKGGIRISYESLGSSRVARFTNSIHFMSEWSFHIAVQECMVQRRHLVRMRFLYQPIPPRMVAMGFPSRRSESLVLCGQTEAADAITVVFGEIPDVSTRPVPLQKKLEGRSILRVRRSDAIDRILGLY